MSGQRGIVCAKISPPTIEFPLIAESERTHSLSNCGLTAQFSMIIRRHEGIVCASVEKDWGSLRGN